MDYAAIEKMTQLVKEKNSLIETVKKEMGKVIFGQNHLIDRIIISFFCDGHILVEGLPGLAKTLTVRSFAKTLSGRFNRIQFTPDILPADLIGTRIYNPKDMEFFTKKGPIFCNILLADEVNRAPAKVQSALLQAMEEKQVTIGEDTYKLESPFMVLATENPIEQEGTYPLPEAQLDRFFMKVLVSYPDKKEELDILKNFGSINPDNVNNVMSLNQITEVKNIMSQIYVDDKLNEYIVNIVAETRSPKNKDIAQLIEFGASPRASIALMKASRAVAFMKGRGFVTPEDIKEIGPDILRHRVILSYEAEAEDISTDNVVKLVFDSVEVP